MLLAKLLRYGNSVTRANSRSTRKHLKRIKYAGFVFIKEIESFNFENILLQADYQKKIADYKRQATDAQLSMLKLNEQILKEEETLKRERKKRDTQLPGKPKRPLTQFAIFSQDLRQKSSQKLTLTEIAVKWRELSDAERKSYTERANENSKRYK